jgi:hypothetical protein
LALLFTYCGYVRLASIKEPAAMFELQVSGVLDGLLGSDQWRYVSGAPVEPAFLIERESRGWRGSWFEIGRPGRRVRKWLY